MGLQVRQIIETIQVHRNVPDCVVEAAGAATLRQSAIRFVWTFCVGVIYSKLRGQPAPNLAAVVYRVVGGNAWSGIACRCACSSAYNG